MKRPMPVSMHRPSELLDLMFERHGFRAEEEAKRQAIYAEMVGDKRGAYIWMQVAWECRCVIGHSPLADRKPEPWWKGL